MSAADANREPRSRRLTVMIRWTGLLALCIGLAEVLIPVHLRVWPRREMAVKENAELLIAPGLAMRAFAAITLFVAAQCRQGRASQGEGSLLMIFGVTEALAGGSLSVGGRIPAMDAFFILLHVPHALLAISAGHGLFSLIGDAFQPMPPWESTRERQP
ncbi:MAG: hypothetical protein HYY93_00300 [Planctomycetes bacterium]|nr:hypothetical protein [Planctomycetota bacterium]